ncbi:hypothetical protein CRE_24263 [Caenorhabditis remanei]|uniref:Uncharacterized protein n=1 Tax=Caenorhabditis remanei TaxID=31234 RepID=E3NHR2_CAERE|nr:hypothetical protein CRE_24263 [Caenorhabditis remanei]
MTEEEDPYALSSSESEDEGPKKPIKIEGRSGDLKQLCDDFMTTQLAIVES